MTQEERTGIHEPKPDRKQFDSGTIETVESVDMAGRPEQTEETRVELEDKGGKQFVSGEVEEVDQFDDKGEPSRVTKISTRMEPTTPEDTTYPEKGITTEERPGSEPDISKKPVTPQPSYHERDMTQEERTGKKEPEDKLQTVYQEIQEKIVKMVMDGIKEGATTKPPSNPGEITELSQEEFNQYIEEIISKYGKDLFTKPPFTAIPTEIIQINKHVKKDFYISEKDIEDYLHVIYQHLFNEKERKRVESLKKQHEKQGKEFKETLKGKNVIWVDLWEWDAVQESFEEQIREENIDKENLKKAEKNPLLKGRWRWNTDTDKWEKIKNDSLEYREKIISVTKTRRNN
ncbi:hypothetical protein GF326_08515 [Candidatus Bathyarchaeota archaeon]|nr:hypothetical protein [Candidatus Bathyarchaeota archaeon]